MSVSSNIVKFKVYKDGFQLLSQLDNQGIKVALSHFLPVYDSRYNNPTAGSAYDVSADEFLSETGISHSQWWINHGEDVTGGYVTAFGGEKLPLAGTYSSNGTYSRQDQYLLVNSGGVEINDPTRLPANSSVTISALVANPNGLLWRVGDYFPIPSQATSGASTAGQWELLVPDVAGDFRFNKIAVFASRYDASGAIVSTFFLGMLYSNALLKKRFLANEYNIPLSIKLTMILTDVPPNAQYDEYVFLSDSRYWYKERSHITTDYATWLGEKIDSLSNAESRYTKAINPLGFDKAPLQTKLLKINGISDSFLFHTQKKALSTLMGNVTHVTDRRVAGSFATPVIGALYDSSLPSNMVKTYDIVTSVFDLDASSNSLANVGINKVVKQGTADTLRLSAISRLDWLDAVLFNPSSSEVGVSPTEVLLRTGLYDANRYNTLVASTYATNWRVANPYKNNATSGYAIRVLGGYADIHGRFVNLVGGGRIGEDGINESEEFSASQSVGSFIENIGFDNRVGVMGKHKLYDRLSAFNAKDLHYPDGNLIASISAYSQFFGMLAVDFSRSIGTDNDIYSDYCDVLGKCISVDHRFSRVTGNNIDIGTIRNNGGDYTNHNSIVGSYLKIASPKTGVYPYSTTTDTGYSKVGKYVKDAFGSTTNGDVKVNAWWTHLTTKMGLGCPPSEIATSMNATLRNSTFAGPSIMSNLVIAGEFVHGEVNIGTSLIMYSSQISGNTLSVAYSTFSSVNAGRSGVSTIASSINAYDSIVSSKVSSVNSERANITALSSSVNMRVPKNYGGMSPTNDVVSNNVYRMWKSVPLYYRNFWVSGATNSIDRTSAYLINDFPIFPRTMKQLSYKGSVYTAVEPPRFFVPNGFVNESSMFAKGYHKLNKTIKVSTNHMDAVAEIYRANADTGVSVGIKWMEGKLYPISYAIVHQVSDNLRLNMSGLLINAIESLWADPTKKAFITIPQRRDTLGNDQGKDLEFIEIGIDDISAHLRAVTQGATFVDIPTLGIRDYIRNSASATAKHFDIRFIGIIVTDGVDNALGLDATEQYNELFRACRWEAESLYFTTPDGLDYIRYVVTNGLHAFVNNTMYEGIGNLENLGFYNPSAQANFVSSSVNSVGGGEYRGIFEASEIFDNMLKYQDDENVVNGLFSSLRVKGRGHVINTNGIGSVVEGVQNKLSFASGIFDFGSVVEWYTNTGAQYEGTSYYGLDPLSSRWRVDPIGMSYRYPLLNGSVADSYHDNIIGMYNKLEHGRKHASGFNYLFGFGHQLAVKFDNSGGVAGLDVGGESYGSWWYNQVFGYRNAIIGLGQTSGVWYGAEGSSGVSVNLPFTGGEFNLVWGRNLIATRREQVVFGVNNKADPINIFELGCGFEYMTEVDEEIVMRTKRMNALSVGYEGRLIDRSDFDTFVRFIDPSDISQFIKNNPHKNIIGEFLAVKCDANMFLIGDQTDESKWITRWFRAGGYDGDTDIRTGDLVYAWARNQMTSESPSVTASISVGSYNGYIMNQMNAEKNGIAVGNGGETIKTTEGFVKHEFRSVPSSRADIIDIMTMTKRVKVIGVALTNSYNGNYNTFTKEKRQSIPYNYANGGVKWVLVGMSGGVIDSTIGDRNPTPDHPSVGQNAVIQFEKLINGGLDEYNNASKMVVAFRKECSKVPNAVIPHLATYTIYIP